MGGENNRVTRSRLGELGRPSQPSRGGNLGRGQSACLVSKKVQSAVGLLSMQTSQQSSRQGWIGLLGISSTQACITTMFHIPRAA